MRLRQAKYTFNPSGHFKAEKASQDICMDKKGISFSLSTFKGSDKYEYYFILLKKQKFTGKDVKAQIFV